MKKHVIICLTLCFVLLLSGCSMVTIGGNIPEEYRETTQDTPNKKYIPYDGYVIHDCGLGIVEIFRHDGTIVTERVGIYADKMRTHLTMLSLHKGMTLPEIVAACGMPDDALGSGFYRLYYKTIDGYQYTLFIRYTTHKLEDIDVIPPGEVSLGETGTLQFRWTVRLVYLGIAAVLGVVLVVLIKVPNAIRKRKAASQPD